MAANNIPHAGIRLPANFKIQAADGRLQPKPTLLQTPTQLQSSTLFHTSALPQKPILVNEPTLGVLENFNGTFVGTGFNAIFRPNSGPPTTTTFPNPVTKPTPPAVPHESVLELNLTTESIAFSPSLGAVPNRGLQGQNDIFLNGVPYVQTVNDVTNLETGKADGHPSPIHFEPGLWMHVPATKTAPVLGETLSRMASIPHGTTINLQGLSPSSSISGPPQIPSVDMTPFPIGDQTRPFRFDSQDASLKATPRLPQDLSKFITAGTINQKILDDPNSVLRSANIGKTITKTTVFTVSTGKLGGGTANIAFLEGSEVGEKAGPSPGPNASAVDVTSTFWVSTVQHEIVVPAFKPGQQPLKLSAPASQPGAPVPVFLVDPPREITSPKKIVVSSTQIQYTQTVVLNFGGLSWPHVSVATLVPLAEQTVPASAWK
jgi:hypothetical protein